MASSANVFLDKQKLISALVDEIEFVDKRRKEYLKLKEKYDRDMDAMVDAIAKNLASGKATITSAKESFDGKGARFDLKVTTRRVKVPTEPELDFGGAMVKGRHYSVPVDIDNVDRYIAELEGIIRFLGFIVGDTVPEKKMPSMARRLLC